MMKHYITGMLEQAKKMKADCGFFEVIKKARLQGWIDACETALEFYE